LKFKTRLRSFAFAASGLWHALKTQANMRIHVAISAAVIAAAIYFQLSKTDWLWLIVSIILVLSAELLNSAFEYVCDVISPQHNASVGRAKDIAAGAVLVVACGAALIGLLVFWPYIYR
jgi:diacylglycerol kinase (ATP)